MAKPVITSDTEATAREGVAFTYSIVATNTPTSYDASPLPDWLTVDTNTGDITGTPPSTEYLSPPFDVITLSAINGDGIGTSTLSIRIELNSGNISLQSVKSAWFAAQGFASNTLNDQISRYLAANGGGPSNSVNNQWRVFLSGKGRVGSLKDMYIAELIASIGGSANSKMSVSDLEYLFYSDTNSTFA